jgi:hypothetical protein
LEPDCAVAFSTDFFMITPLEVLMLRAVNCLLHTVADSGHCNDTPDEQTP